MATTLKVINELFDETIEEISRDSENWQSFLKTASMNYKYSFSDQLLIYAQRPNSTACADYDTWNNVFGRYVKGEGIALLTEYNGRPRLRYVWDIKNTHIKYHSNGKRIELWKIEKSIEDKLIENLKSKYEYLENKNNFIDVVKSLSNNLVLNNYYNYYEGLVENKNDIKLKHLNDEVIERKFKELLENSVAYMIINRCGINPASYFDNSDFIEIVIFNDVDNISRLGIAISDISEIGINEIHNSLIELKNKEKIYTLDKKKNLLYDENEKKNHIERRDENEYSIYENKGYETTKPNGERESGEQSRKVFNDEITILEREQENGLSNDADERHIDRTFGGNREDISREITIDNEPNDDRVEHQRGIESNEPNGMGRDDEQYQESSRRNDIERTNLQLEEQENTDDSIPFSLEEYSYEVGDKVFIGETEFEISNIGIFDITLHDINFPILSRAMNIVEFETKMKENPANDHLKKKQIKEISNDDSSIIKQEEKEIINKPKNVKSNSSQLSLFKNKEQELADTLLDIFNSLDTRYKDSLYVKEIELKKWDHISSKKKNLTIIIKSQNYDEFGDNSFTQFNSDKTDEKTIINEIQNNEFIKRLNKDDDFSITLTPTSIIVYYHNFEDKVINYDIEIIKDNIVIEDNVIDEIDEVPIKNDTSNYYVEVPTEKRINYKITDDNLGVDTPKERYKNNIEAIKVLKQCELENRFATKEEQDILAKYVGWGGLSQAFDKDNSSWEKEYKELKELLTTDEYNKAMDSTLTAFYTPPIVIRSMYKALSNMGFDKGNILEPSCGVGNFIGMLPDNENLKVYGIEIDPVSGNIARQLYQKSSIEIKGFEKVDYSDSFFDVAIGNVPFGDFTINDTKYNKNNFLIHDYFFAKTIDKVRPGGIIAFITSKGTLDKENSKVRKYLSQRADLIGAIRLPNDTFKRSAGTTITSDIVFLQKRNSITDIEPSWVKLGVNEDGIRINNYFIEHPEMILGEMKIDDYRGDTICVPFENSNLEELLNSAISNIKAEITDYEREEIEEETKSIVADMNVKNFSYTVIEDKIYYRENSRMYLQDLPSATESRIKGLIEIRDCVRELIKYQLEDYSDEVIEEQQNKLNNLYDKFTKKYGLINSRGNSTAFSNDNSYFLLCSLEVLDTDGNLLRKADMFTKRTIKPHTKIDKANNAIDARILSLTEKAKIDLDYMSEISTIPVDKLIEDLKGDIFKDPITEEWQTSEEYLSGDVREKLEIAEEYAKDNSDYDINVEYLKQVIPKDIATSEISVRLGATWIPTSDYQDFMFELLEPSYFARQKLKVHLSEINGEWTIEGKNYDRYGVKITSTYGTKRANAYRLLEDALNLRDTKIFDYEINNEGKKEAILNKKETAIAQAKQDIIKNKFSEWIWKEPERRERLTNLYNRKFNAIRPREYDGSFMIFQGMNPEIKLRTHQINSIAMMVYGGNTLLAQEVGAGKTFSMIAAAMESKRLGLCNKSLFVVPNHIIEQFASEFLELYPSANILVSTKKDFETKNRKKFCSRIATGDYDAIIIGHSQFEKIPMSVKRQETILNRQLDDILNGIEELKRNNGEKITIKQLMRSKKSVESKLEKLNNQTRKDDVITFEELGVDKIFVDEAHYYKNLYFHTKMRNVGGIAQTEAQKTMDLFMKTQYLDEITGNKGTVLATGTPISNSMVELYTFQRYLQYDTLVKYNLQHFDAWASTFGETITALEIAPEGTGFRAKTRFARFYNLPELMAMFKQIADIKTADMLNLPVPEMEDVKVLIEPSDVQLEIMESFIERAENIRNGNVEPTQDNMLKITNEGRKLAIDPKLLDENLPEHNEGKINTSSDYISKIWEDTKDERLTQMVFCDIGTPNNDGKFNVYDELKKKLIDKGVAENEIEFIHNAKNDSQKKEIFSKVRQGVIRILIGSTQKMGAGTNCQDLLIAEHNLDCPWRPSDFKQRRGRIERQGNKNKKAYVYSYLGKKTHDAFMYGKLESKQKALSQVMTSKSPLRSMEDVDETSISYAEMKALASDNPLMMEKIELETQVSKLRLLKQSHLSQMYELEDKIRKEYPMQIKNLENTIKNYKEDIEHLELNTKLNSDGFSPMIINNKEYKDKKEAVIALNEQILNHPSKEPRLIGEYRGFKLESSYDSLFRQYKLSLINNQEYSVPLGDSASGNLTRIDNVLENLSNGLDRTINKLSEIRTQLEMAKEEVKRPFNQEEELKEKTKRLDEVDILLDLNEKTNIIIDEKDDRDKENQVYKEEYAR